MGAKSTGRKGCEKENYAEKVLSNKNDKKKTKGSVNDSDLELSASEIESGFNNQEIETKKKNKKPWKSSADVEPQVMEKVDDLHKFSNRDDFFEMTNEEVDQRNKKNKKEMHEDSADAHLIKSGVEFENGRKLVDVESPMKKKKRKELQHNVDSESRLRKIKKDHGSNKIEDAGNKHLAENQAGDGKVGSNGCNAANGKDEKKRKKRKREDFGGVGMVIEGEHDGEEAGNEKECWDEHMKKLERSSKDAKKKKNEKKKKNKKNDCLEGEGSERERKMDGNVKATDSPEKCSPNKSKRVSFSEDVEVFPSFDGPNEETQTDELVQGKRFSPEEDEMVKVAVLSYIDAHALGEEGLDMVLHCKKYPKIKNCWKEIGAALPWRPYYSVYYRAHILFERSENRKWTPEEVEIVRNFHEKYGSDWKTLAEVLGKHRFHVKDTWRRIKLKDRNKGKWSQEEYQNLFDLVNVDLRLRALEEARKTKYGMLRDNISWTAISDKLGTRATPSCCIKWYDQLTSPMVAQGEWHDVDDYRLLIALYNLDACSMEDVDWENLLEHRSGAVCRKRWSQMVKHIGENGNKSFADQVEVLMNRYCPDVLEAREAYDSKPAVT